MITVRQRQCRMAAHCLCFVEFVSVSRINSLCVLWHSDANAAEQGCSAASSQCIHGFIALPVFCIHAVARMSCTLASWAAAFSATVCWHGQLSSVVQCAVKLNECRLRSSEQWELFSVLRVWSSVFICVLTDSFFVASVVRFHLISLLGSFIHALPLRAYLCVSWPFLSYLLPALKWWNIVFV